MSNDENTNRRCHPPAPAKQTAADAYATHRRNISRMLGWIEDELEAHAARQQASPRNWGFTGDLAEMERLVKRALGHISGTDEAVIDRLLGELDA
jgi:hypothetical protein